MRLARHTAAARRTTIANRKKIFTLLPRKGDFVDYRDVHRPAADATRWDRIGESLHFEVNVVAAVVASDLATRVAPRHQGPLQFLADAVLDATRRVQLRAVIVQHKSLAGDD